MKALIILQTIVRLFINPYPYAQFAINANYAVQAKGGMLGEHKEYITVYEDTIFVENDTIMIRYDIENPKYFKIR